MNKSQCRNIVLFSQCKLSSCDKVDIPLNTLINKSVHDEIRENTINRPALITLSDGLHKYVQLSINKKVGQGF